ncbi:MAG: hypothetical protein H5U40_14285 [Polyangiaceae bacterium]|nr:hypothetical protein [Polyangiaceae bacterium]
MSAGARSHERVNDLINRRVYDLGLAVSLKLLRELADLAVGAHARRSVCDGTVFGTQFATNVADELVADPALLRDFAVAPLHPLRIPEQRLDRAALVHVS